MHVHGNYSLQLASLGAGREESEKIAAKKAAEVRRKLSIASGALREVGDEVKAVTARPEERRGYQEPESGEFGRLFSARA